MAIDFAAKILSEAVLVALRGEGLPRERLKDCVAQVSILGEGDHLPASLQERLDAMMTPCTRDSDPDKMDYWEASKWLEELFSIHTEVIKREQRESIAREIAAVQA